EISRDRQQAQNCKQDEAASLDHFVFRAQSRNVKAEHKNEPDRREDAHKNVQMRPRLRNQMHIIPLPRIGILGYVYVIVGEYQTYVRCVSGIAGSLRGDFATPVATAGTVAARSISLTGPPATSSFLIVAPLFISLSSSLACCQWSHNFRSGSQVA